jgi:hypothetical protein
MHSTEPLIPYHSFSDVEIAIGNFEKDKIPYIDQILVQMIQRGGKIFWNKEELPHQCKKSIIAPIY